ncbi:hypothetical protein NHQ30_007579 [Ciborinia camelliae]|nr:hypothetical protein NHQ30_007579 [Ciborinia camelliae]
MIDHFVSFRSNQEEGGLDPGLSYQGERDCNKLYESMRQHARHITHIFSSPMKRCLETARKGLLEVTGRGIRIQIMPALAGRNGATPWTLREESQENDIHGPWVKEAPDSRSKSKDVDFVMEWLTVSQTQLLNNLLWKIKGSRHGWPNATIFTYSLSGDRKWTRCKHQKNIDSHRYFQQTWKREIMEAAVMKRRWAEEEAEEKRIEERSKNESENSNKAEMAKLDQQMQSLLALQTETETERIRKDSEELVESPKSEKAKSDKLKRDSLTSQGSS